MVAIIVLAIASAIVLAGTINAASHSVCNNPPAAGKNAAYDILVKALCYKPPNAKAHTCHGVNTDISHAIVCALGSGMCGIDKANNKKITAVGKILPAILKVIPFMDQADPDGLTCGQVQQACCHAGSSVDMAEALIDAVMAEPKRILANIDHVTDEAVLVVRRKVAELKKTKVVKEVIELFDKMVKMYDDVIDKAKLAADNAIQKAKGTDVCKAVTHLSDAIKKAVDVVAPAHVCKKLQAEAKLPPKSNDPAYVATVKTVCGDAAKVSDTAAHGSPAKPGSAGTAAASCGGVAVDVSSSLICAIGASTLKLVPMAKTMVDNPITCAVVENACCHTAGNFEAANNLVTIAMGDKSAIFEALEDVVDAVMNAIKQATDDIVKACGETIDDIVNIGNDISNSIKKLFSRRRRSLNFKRQYLNH